MAQSERNSSKHSEARGVNRRTSVRWTIHVFVASLIIISTFALSIRASFADSVEYWNLQFDSSVSPFEAGNEGNDASKELVATLCLHRNGNLLEGRLMYQSGAAPDDGAAYEYRSVEGNADKNQILLFVKHQSDRPQIAKFWQEGFVNAASEYASSTLTADQYLKGVTQYKELANSIPIGPSGKGNDLVLRAEKTGGAFGGSVTQSVVLGTGKAAGIPTEISRTKPIPASVGARFKMERMADVPKFYRDSLQSTPKELLRNNLRAFCKSNESLCAAFAKDNEQAQRLNADALEMLNQEFIKNSFSSVNSNRAALKSHQLHRRAEFRWFCGADGKCKVLRVQ